MIIEKDFDLDLAVPELIDALMMASESADFQGIWVNKFDEDGKELWRVNFSEPDGIRLFTALEEAGFLAIYRDIDSLEEAKNVNVLMANLIEKRWNNQDTNHVTTTTYRDEYDMYGVSRGDF